MLYGYPKASEGAAGLVQWTQRDLGIVAADPIPGILHVGTSEFSV